ncbi:hypothetical protein PENANT_c030G04237 [Penicillium antarcticum]|uniref:Alkyl hydroperoxide reductase subunit C/ Thiol specific antioxidant domain-containing protein n=1 Tax=Penicillium antarcticum TaxID=416450 RepID=A0A1V6PXA6_9EURO|nr:uncharacterized protein N7508_001562 [Penicillium antarcticum]KAJ5317054.1 hypothetical protein N7508_001562 [Penicillium antarcticum]OQD81086.1 hypothetical protein PENANT_c030G04237 [Penicillium antarcticum]
MTISQELSSWSSPSYIETSSAPSVGNKAPSCPQLVLPAVAEATFLTMRNAASQYPNINFMAISHSDKPSTDKWLEAIGGTGGASSASVSVLVDAEREIYAKWGLGVVPWSHVLSPGGLLGVWKIGKENGIWNRLTESGSRWQCSGHWAVDEEGVVRWGGPAARADEVIDIEAAIGALQKTDTR